MRLPRLAHWCGRPLPRQRPNRCHDANACLSGDGTLGLDLDFQRAASVIRTARRTSERAITRVVVAAATYRLSSAPGNRQRAGRYALRIVAPHALHRAAALARS